MMNTIVTVDLSKKVISAEMVAMLRGEKTTKTQLQEFEEKLRADINNSLINKGRATICLAPHHKFERRQVLAITHKLQEEFKSQGYMVGGYDYADSNKKQLCWFYVEL